MKSERDIRTAIRLLERAAANCEMHGESEEGFYLRLQLEGLYWALGELSPPGGRWRNLSRIDERLAKELARDTEEAPDDEPEAVN